MVRRVLYAVFAVDGDSIVSPDRTVSVVIPTFNRADLICRAVVAAQSQTCPVHEIIVVDDGSTDETPQVCKQFGPPVRYIQQPNAGAAAARNTGIQVATGRWIAFLDSDDEWYPTKLERQFEALRTQPQLRWCSCNAESISHGIKTRYEPGKGLERELADYGYFRSFFRAFERGAVFQTPGMLVQTELLQAAGGFDTRLREAEDEDLWSRVALLAPSIGYVMEPLYLVHADTPGSLSKEGHRLESTLTSVAKILPLAQAAGGETERIYRRFVRGKVFRMMLRAMGQGTDIRTLRRLPLAGLGLTWLHWGCLAMLAMWPQSVSVALEWRVRAWHKAWSVR